MREKLTECFPALEIGDLDLNESIGAYWQALDDEDRKWSLAEEANARDTLKFRILTDEQYEKLQGSSAPAGGKTLQGVHSYDILANTLYLDDFQYVTAAEENRAECIIDDDEDEGNDAAQSDLVRLALNLAYLTEAEAQNFRMGKQAVKDMRQSAKIN